MELNLFEHATKSKLRFRVANGSVGVEDLWDMSLPDLDVLGKRLRREAAEASDSLIADVKPDETLTQSFEIVKRIIDVKLEEKRAKADRLARRQRRQQLEDALAEKKAAGLKDKSIAEIEAELEQLG